MSGIQRHLHEFVIVILCHNTVYHVKPQTKGISVGISKYISIPDDVDLDPKLVLVFLYHLHAKKEEHGQHDR